MSIRNSGVMCNIGVRNFAGSELPAYVSISLRFHAGW